MSSFRFFDLPMELQDRILHFALVVGEVYPPPLWHGYHYDSPPPPLNINAPEDKILIQSLCPRERAMPALAHCRGTGSQKLAVGLLATSKEMRRRCQPLFYSRNVFCLPPGPTIVLEEYFNRMLRPESKSLIKTILFDFSFDDFTVTDLLYLETRLQTTRAAWLHPDRHQQTEAWIDCIMNVLHHRWYERLQWLEDRLESTEMIISILGNAYRVPHIPDRRRHLDFMISANGDRRLHDAQYDGLKVFRRICATYRCLLDDIESNLRERLARCRNDLLLLRYRWSAPWRVERIYLLDMRRIRYWLLDESPLDYVLENRIVQAEKTLPEARAETFNRHIFRKSRVAASLKYRMTQNIYNMFR